MLISQLYELKVRMSTPARRRLMRDFKRLPFDIFEKAVTASRELSCEWTWVKCELRVVKLRVGILRVEVRAKRASI